MDKMGHKFAISWSKSCQKRMSRTKFIRSDDEQKKMVNTCEEETFSMPFEALWSKQKLESSVNNWVLKVYLTKSTRKQSLMS